MAMHFSASVLSTIVILGHCDYNDVTLSFFNDAALTNNNSTHINSTGFLQVTNGTNGAARGVIYADSVRGHISSRYNIVLLGPMNASSPKGFYDWSVVQTTLLDVIGPVDVLLVLARDPDAFRKNNEAEVVEWCARNDFPGYARVAQGRRACQY